MLSKPPTPPVPWHWKQLDARRRPLVLAGWVIALVVLLNAAAHLVKEVAQRRYG